ncbi:MAG: DUF3179 domain-containing (seleno)protein [SAR202 cluster bacterium]|nr:DUF3179 domain-containing (seleno)protein [SAR202 cluster bacterium]
MNTSIVLRLFALSTVGTFLVVAACSATASTPAPENGGPVVPSPVDAAPATASADPQTSFGPDDSPFALFSQGVTAPVPEELQNNPEYQQLLTRDAIKPIYTPVITTKEDAQLDADDLVMGVSVDGESRAYPISTMRFKEIVNDELGGRPILVTWCTLCYTGLVHERLVDGEPLLFGNQGALYKGAMTWWDWKTQSVWSQPWGAAISGPLRGTALTLIPASVVPWSTWKAEHPETTVLANILDRERLRVQVARDDFVIGVALEESATAYDYRLAAERRVINDRIGDNPVAVFVDADTRDIKVFLRRLPSAPEDDTSTSEVFFRIDGDGRLLDEGTGSVWDMTRGVAVEGPLAGTRLQSIPYITSFDWAWRDFYPHTTFYG